MKTTFEVLSDLLEQCLLKSDDLAKNSINKPMAERGNDVICADVWLEVARMIIAKREEHKAAHLTSTDPKQRAAEMITRSKLADFVNATQYSLWMVEVASAGLSGDLRTVLRLERMMEEAKPAVSN